ncbi:MAG: hypothetical protein HY291_15640 [Planctomycetes bacterium]|nr:hypothetical protein [Planctomycetota bacterium]
MVVMESRRVFQAFVATLAIMLVATCMAAAGGEAKLAVCPVSLTNPDGQDLAIEKYELRVALHGPLALTEMELTFRNPVNRQIEGRFMYLLPTGATVSRFAKEVDGKLMEGEVVETQRARQVYREILHSLRDPALLEQDQGNRFSAKVFPIPANGTVRLVLSYSQTLPLKGNERKLTIPLAGMPKIGDFTFNGVVQYFSGESLGEDTAKYLSAQAMDGQVIRLNKHATDFTPDRDIELSFKPAVDAPRLNVLKAGNYEMVAYRDDLPASEEANVKRDWVFYFDTSASGADMEARKLEAATKLFSALKSRGAEKVLANAFDTDVAFLYQSNTLNVVDGATTSNIVDSLRRRHCLGATDLGQALKHIGAAARATKEPARFVLVSDGIATWGKREIAEVVAELGEWPAQHVLHALVLGNKQDEKMLNAITAKTNGRVIELPLNDKMDESVAKTVAELTEPLGHSFEFYDEGAAWIYPKTFRDVRPGSEMIVFCELKEGAKAKPGVTYPKGLGRVDVPLDGTPAETPAFAPLLKREAVGALLNHMEKLEQEEKDAKKVTESKLKRVELSVKNRVLCPPLTSLLVLETENDYARFKIERTSLADVMVVGAAGIELKARKAEDLALRPAPPAPAKPSAKFKGRMEKQADAKEDKALGEETAEAGKNAEQLKKLDDATKAEPLQDMEDKAGKDAQLEQAAPGAAVDQLRADEGGFGSRAGGGRRQQAQQGQGGQDGRPAEHSQAGERAATAAPTAPPAPEARAVADPTNRPDADRERAASTPTAQQNAATEEGRREVANNQTPANNKFQAPAWTSSLSKPADDGEFNVLRSKVEGAPRDRNLRNMYANALAQAQKWDTLQALCFEWMPFDPENPQVYEYLGKSAAGLGDGATALRAVSSIAEIAPHSAELLGRGGWVLLTAKKYEMATALFQEALKQRQDEPNLYRGLALSLWLSGDFKGAAETLEGAREKDFHNRYGDVKRVYSEELGYLYRAWIKSQDGKASTVQAEITERAAKHGIDLKRADALRITLGWETDACDVDLHVVDPNGEECFYSHKNNVSCLELYSDQTQGLGPEVIRCEKAIPGTYHIGVNYFSAGPMGVSRGVIVVFQPKDGVVEAPVIVPFCLIPDTGAGKDMRHLATAQF